MKLAYDVYIPPEGAADTSLSPIIFVHGGMHSKKTWKKLAMEVATKTGREVYAPDMRNHGESPWSDEMNHEVLMSDLVEFMDDLDIHKAILTGHSLGGIICMGLALHKPEIVEKLIVEDCNTNIYNPITVQTIQQIIILFRESIKTIPPKSSETEAKNAISAFTNRQLPPAEPGQTQRGFYDLDTMPIKKEGDKYVWQANLDAIEAMLISERVHKKYSGVYPRDALFLYGTKSFFNVNEDENVNKFFPRAVKVPVEGAGHLIHQDHPEEFVKHITDFILK